MCLYQSIYNTNTRSVKMTPTKPESIEDDEDDFFVAAESNKGDKPFSKEEPKAVDLPTSPFPSSPKKIPDAPVKSSTKLGGKALSKPANKRHKKVLRDNIQGVTKPAIRRLARRGGVKRISGLVYDEARKTLKDFLDRVLRDVIVYTEHSRRKTVTSMDVIHALRRQGRTIFGYGF